MLKLKGETFVVGDVHGRPTDLLRKTAMLEAHPKKVKHIILLGDIGFGFVRGRHCKRLTAVAAALDCADRLEDVDDDKFIDEFVYCVKESAKELVLSLISVARILTGNKDVQVYAIRGNHDNPEFWDRKTKFGKAASSVDSNFHFLNDGFIDINNELWLTIGGGVSIDRFTAGRVEGVSWWAGEEIDGSFDKPLPIGYKYLTGILSHTGKIPTYAQYKHPDANEGYVAKALKREMEAIDSLAVRYNPTYWIYGHFHGTWVRTIPGQMLFSCIGASEMIALDKTSLRKALNGPRNRF